MNTFTTPRIGGSAMKRLLMAFAAALAVTVAAQSPALANPEVWLRAGTGSWKKDEITFGLTCPNVAYQMPDFVFVPPDNTPVSTGYDHNDRFNVASSFIEVEGRNIGQDEEWRDEELPPNHPGRAWGITTWGQLIHADIEPKYELTIRLEGTSSTVTDTLHLSSVVWQRKGPVITVTRRWDTLFSDKTIPVSTLCPLGSSATHSVTVRATITGRTRID